MKYLDSKPFSVAQPGEKGHWPTCAKTYTCWLDMGHKGPCEPQPGPRFPQPDEHGSI